MLDKIFEQTQAAFKPASELATLNAEIMQEALDKQKAFFSDMLTDGMSYAKELSSQKDFSGVYQVQKNYMETMQEKWIAASTDAYNMFTTSQEKAKTVITGDAA